jgi:hypothetical protein
MGITWKSDRTADYILWSSWIETMFLSTTTTTDKICYSSRLLVVTTFHLSVYKHERSLGAMVKMQTINAH